MQDDDNRNKYFHGKRVMDHIFKHFAKTTLGCGCEDTVFEEIEFIKKRHPDKNMPFLIRILIGQKLLIYINQYHHLTREDVFNIFSAGKAERDQKGFNRFRGVFFTDDIQSDKSVIENFFNTIPDKDEKIHLHVIDSQIIRKLFY